ncbi:MAG: hypothetical protein IKI33_03975 [Eubacterium sp.]|nr:hypothetical protein [Eubacterium sp.]
MLENTLKNNPLIPISLNIVSFMFSVFCIVKRLTINYFAIMGNDTVDVYLYSTVAVGGLLLSVLLLIVNVRIKNDKGTTGLLITAVIVLVLTIICSITAKTVPVNVSLNGETALKEYSSMFPLDKIKTNEKYEDDYSFESVTLKNDYIATSIQKRTFAQKEGIESLTEDPYDTWIMFISDYAYSDSYRIKEITTRRKIVSIIKGEADSEIVYDENGFTVYDGEINYEVTYESENEFFYAMITRNKNNTINDEDFLTICKQMLLEYRGNAIS